MLPGAASGLDDFRVLADALPQLVWMTGPDGAFQYVNAQWSAYTGMRADEALGDGWFAAIEPSRRSATHAQWSQAHALGVPYEFAFPIRGRDGSYRAFLIRGAPVRDGDGTIRKWYGTCTDIEDRNRSEASLRFLAESGELLGATLDAKHALRVLARLVTESIADWCTIFLFDEETERLVPLAVAHGDAGDLARMEAFLASTPTTVTDRLASIARAGRSQRTKRIGPEHLADYANDPAFFGFLQTLELRSSIVVPIVARERTLGVLQAVTSRSRRTFSGEDVRLAELLAKRAATAIDNAALYDEQRRTAQRLQFIAEASAALANSLDLEETLATLVRLPVPTFADWTVLNLVDANGVIGAATAFHRDPSLQDLADAFVRFAHPDPTARHGRGHVLQSRKSELKAHIDPAYAARIVHEIGFADRTADTLRTLGYAASITVPILIDGEMRGILAAFRGEQEARYAPADVLVFEDLARRAATAIGNAENYLRESRASQLFQKAFLPVSLPDVHGLDFHAIYAPGEAEAQIGGDWYDAFPLPDGRIVVSIGDVTGRGLQAAVIMAKMRQSLQTLAFFERDPARLLEAADVTLRRIDPDALVTALVGVIDPARGTFSYATAGHPAPILCSPGGDIVKLPGRGLPLGLRDDVETPTTTVRLPDGALVVLFTDGLIESTHDILEGERRLDAALADPAVVGSDDPARAIQRRVLFDGSPDDVAILTLRYTAADVVTRTPSPMPQTALSMHWSFDAREARTSQDVRGVYAQYLRELAEDGADVAAAELVFGELLSNVVRHAPGPVEIELEWTATRPVLHVLDRGNGFERTMELPRDQLSENGRGLYIINGLTEEFTVTKLPGYGTHARAVLSINRA